MGAALDGLQGEFINHMICYGDSYLIVYNSQK
jgi:hypothetical protein